MRRKKQALIQKLITPLLQGLLLVGVLASGLYAYAYVSGGITWPDASPNTATGVLGRFVGFSKNADGSPYTYSAALASYQEANQKGCGAYGLGAHVCSEAEMLHGNAVLFSSLPAAGSAWVNGGAPGFTANANDCGGWQRKTGDYYGRYWDFAKRQGWMRFCTENELPFACCI